MKSGVLWIDEAETRELIDVARARTLIFDALVEHAAARTTLSEPRSMFLRSGNDRPYFHVKGASLDGPGLVGFRLGGIVPPALSGRDVRWLILCDRDTTEPLAIIEERHLYRLRVGMSIALTIERLRRRGASRLAMVGAGPLARATLECVAEVTPFEEIRIASRTEVSRTALARAACASGVNVVTASSVEDATTDADVVVSLTTAEGQIIGREVMRPGVLVLPCGGRQECDPAVLLEADALFVDDWHQCTLLGDIAPLARAGRLQESDVAGTVAGVVAGTVAGRRRDVDMIVAVVQGLTPLDVALAVGAYERARARTTANVSNGVSDGSGDT